MEIKTKYNLGDKLWGLIENQVRELKISKIIAYVEEEKMEINYEFKPCDVEEKLRYGYYERVKEEEVSEKFYSSKQDLLASL